MLYVDYRYEVKDVKSGSRRKIMLNDVVDNYLRCLFLNKQHTLVCSKRTAPSRPWICVILNVRP